MSLAPEIQAYLKRLEALNLPQVWQAPVDVIRRNTQSRVATSGPVEAIYEISNRFIPIRYGGAPHSPAPKLYWRS